jgi:hypothetical protein
LEKFLESGEMRDDEEIQFLLDLSHISDIFDKLTVMLVPIIFEENKDEKLMLGVDLLRVFTRVRRNPG